MPIDSINSASTTGIRTLEQVRTANNELGKDAFLQILVAQMANQDPLSPTSDTEFIAQMAQFSALEQMQNMNSNLESQKAYSYLGKEITAAYAVDAEGTMYRQDIYGQVLAVVKLGGKEYLQVQDYENGFLYLVPPDQVSSTMNNNSIESRLANMAALLGQVVTNTQPKEEAPQDTQAQGAAEAGAQDGQSEAPAEA